MLKNLTDEKFSTDKTAENSNRCRNFCPPKNFVRRKLCPPKFCPIRYAMYVLWITCESSTYIGNEPEDKGQEKTRKKHTKLDVC